MSRINRKFVLGLFLLIGAWIGLYGIFKAENPEIINVFDKIALIIILFGIFIYRILPDNNSKKQKRDVYNDKDL